MAAVAESGHSSTFELDLANQAARLRTSASMDIDVEDPSLSASSFWPQRPTRSNASTDSGYYSSTSHSDTVALKDSRMPPLQSSSKGDRPFNSSYQDFHYDSTVAQDVQNATIDKDDELLKFQPSIHPFTLLDTSLQKTSVSLNARLHGMFFMADPSVAPGHFPHMTSPELNCYRHNLFQVTGSITLSRILHYILTDRGDRISIVAQELAISATESVEGGTVKLISVPWKTSINSPPFPPKERTEKEPTVIPIDLISHHDPGVEFVTCPFAWKRLQFRIITGNNGRRKELQQHFVAHLKLVATLSSGDRVIIAEARSAAIIVRRAPRNFQTRRDFPVNREKVHEKPHPQIWPSERSNDIPEGTRSVTAENGTLKGHVSEGCAHNHDSDEISRPSNALAYSTDSAMDVSTPMKGGDRVPNKHTAAHAKVETVLESLTACRHPVNEDEDKCESSTIADDQPQIAFAQELASDKDGNGHLSDEYEGSLSADENSVKSGSENEYDSTSEGSVLNCSQRALISRLMDEICSLFFFQVSHRPRQRGQDGQGARGSSSDSTERTITSNHSNNQSSVSRGKRIHKDDEAPEDEDNGEHKRRRTQDFDDGHSTRVRYFACPFHKFDASTYGNGNEDPRLGLKYRSCGPPGWPTIGKVK